MRIAFSLAFFLASSGCGSIQVFDAAPDRGSAVFDGPSDGHAVDAAVDASRPDAALPDAETLAHAACSCDDIAYCFVGDCADATSYCQQHCGPTGYPTSCAIGCP